MKGIILAAGRGTRLHPLTREVPKALIHLENQTVLERIIYTLSMSGVQEAVIVVGYMADKIKKKIGDLCHNVRITYVMNNYFDTYRWQYSLALTEDELRGSTCILIEGDLVIGLTLIQAVANAPGQTVLIDKEKQLDPKRSVVVLGKDDTVESFVYDEDHKDVFALIPDKAQIIGESMQVWKFDAQGATILADELRSFKQQLTSNEGFSVHELYAINRAIKRHTMKATPSQGLPWLNLNTVQDVDHAKKLIREGKL